MASGRRPTMAAEADGGIGELRRQVGLARERIRGHVRETPVQHSPSLSSRSGCDVHLKLENFQITGSFKLRGAMNKLLDLDESERARGVVAASAGNHGAAVGYGAQSLGCRAVVFVPENISTVRVSAIREYGAEVQLRGADCVVTEHAARSFADDNQMVYVSPYNDLTVIAGQGTVAAELSTQIGSVDAVFVALGGGGLISGIAGQLKADGGGVEVIACSPENSRVMHESVAAGRILDLESKPTLSESTAGGIEEDTITLDFCRSLVDRFVSVSESEIATSMRSFIEQHHMLIEGAAGVAIAGFLKEAPRLVGKTVAIVICGANISTDQMRVVLGP